MFKESKLKDTELCTFCNETKETLLHHLFECIHVKNIWIKLASNVRSNLNININLLPDYFVFLKHVYRTGRWMHKYMYILLLKKYIFNSKCESVIPTFEKGVEFVKLFKLLDLKSCGSYTTKKSNHIKSKWENYRQSTSGGCNNYSNTKCYEGCP